MSRKFDRPILEESKIGVESKSEDQEAKTNESKDFLSKFLFVITLNSFF